MNVPGLGKVNIVSTINQEAATVLYGPHMKQLVWDWARLFNQEVPILIYGDKNVAFQYSTSRYVWSAHKDGVWNVMGLRSEERSRGAV